MVRALCVNDACCRRRDHHADRQPSSPRQQKPRDLRQPVLYEANPRRIQSHLLPGACRHTSSRLCCGVLCAWRHCMPWDRGLHGTEMPEELRLERSGAPAAHSEASQPSDGGGVSQPGGDACRTRCAARIAVGSWPVGVPKWTEGQADALGSREPHGLQP